MEYIISQNLSDGRYRYISNKSNKISVSYRLPDIKRNYRQDSGEYNEEGLIVYLDQFKQWVNEMKTRKGYKINYLQFYNNTNSIYLIFKRLCQIDITTFGDVDAEEYMWISQCNNSAIQYCNPIETTCFGYDFKSYYPKIMQSSDFMFPTNKGRAIKCLKIADNIRWGYYKVKIESDDPNIKKVFSFSKNHVYTKTSLDYAIKLMKSGYDIVIKLDTTLDKNAYIYDKADMISGNKIFQNWFRKLNYIKKQYPKNKLIKSIMSRLWGTLCVSSDKSYNTIDDIDKNNMWDDISMTLQTKYYLIDHIESDNEKKYYYILRNNENPMRYPLGRIKPWITSYGRNKIADVALLDIDNVVRIQTDNVTYSKKQKFSKKYCDLLPEDKTTGLVEWKHVNKWNNKTLDIKYGKW